MPKSAQAIAGGVRRDAARRGVTLSANQARKVAAQRIAQSRAATGPRNASKQMHGRGNFFSDAYKWAKEKVPKGTLAALGNASGIPGAGLMMGELAKATGIGDYTIRKNSIIDDNAPTKHFSFSDFGGARVRIKKREYLGTIVGDATSPEAFTQQQFRLQITDPTTFPWAHKIGELFTEWQLIGGIMSFESTSSNYSSAVGLGTVAIATQYNANTLPYTSMDNILQAAYHTRGNPSENLLHGIECDPDLQASEHLYTRRPDAAGPPNLYDHGVVTIATEGLPATAAGAVLGRLYWTYDVEVSLPETAIVAPYENRIMSAAGASSDILPPLGPSLTLTNLNSDLTIGTVAGDNVLLLAAASGPSVKPILQPAQNNELMCWINDSSLSPLDQYLTFSRAGNYCLQVDIVNGSGVSPTAGGLTVTGLANNVVVGSSAGIAGGTSIVRTYWFTLEVLKAETGFLLTCAQPAGTYAVYSRIHAC